MQDLTRKACTHREAVEGDVEDIEPFESLRRAIRDVKAGRTYPVESLWQGIDA